MMQTFDKNNDIGTVLIVEDSRAMRSLLTAYLDDMHGIKTVEAATFADAQRELVAHASRFFAAVLDLHLPDAEHGEIVDLVRRYGIPVVVLTGSMDFARREMMLARQVVDYFIKHNHNEVEQVAQTISRLWHNRQVKVLVVDDSRSFRAYLQSLLESYRYQTLTANNGLEALELLNLNHNISLIITDVNMPGMNGLELIEAIRQQHRREDLAIIGMSDASRPNLPALLLKTGANDFIAKPFQAEEFFCRVTQNTNMIEYVRRLRDAATHDFLTGIFNRRHALEMSETLYANARRGHFRIALGMIDIDHFKRVNDTFGHLVGDEVLKVIANALCKTLRSSDIVGRYGGEEFFCVVVLKQEDDAKIVFDRIRAAVEHIEFYVETQRVPLTASVGFTTSLEGSLLNMIAYADKAVYQAKEQGRNQVVMCG